jgi:hypothetical protein
LVALGNLGAFAAALALAPPLARAIAGEEPSWWVQAEIILAALIALVAVDVALWVLLLRPARPSSTDPSAAADRGRGAGP